VSQKLVRALACPLKVGLNLRRVISRPEKGSELSRRTLIGAPRMRFEEGAWKRIKGLQQTTDAGVPGPGSILAPGLCGVALTVRAVCCS